MNSLREVRSGLSIRAQNTPIVRFFRIQLISSARSEGTPQMLRRYGVSARSARARDYDRIMHDSPLPEPIEGALICTSRTGELPAFVLASGVTGLDDERT